MEPSGIGDIGDTEGLDHISYFLALSEQLTQFANGLFGTITFFRYLGLLLESV
jgi:hypothetical protein